MEWKHEILREFKPHSVKHYQAQYPFCYFKTASHSWFSELREKFYRNNKKIVPDNIDEILQGSQTLVIWAMDDGTLDKRQRSFLFETQCFEENDPERLRKCLERNYGLESQIHRSGIKRGKRLYLTVNESRKLSKIIEPNMIQSLRYKLPIPL